MTYEDVKSIVARAITDIQEVSGRECPEIVAGSTPIGDVPGFDSLNALEATVIIAEQVAMEIPIEINIFINEAGDAALSISEIAERIMEFETRTEGVANGI